MSTKFSKSKPVQKPPGVCKAGPRPIPPLWPGLRPPQYQCSYSWRDPQRIPPYDLGGRMPLQIDTTLTQWSGVSAPDGMRVYVRMTETSIAGTYWVWFGVYSDASLIVAENVEIDVDLTAPTWIAPLISGAKPNKDALYRVRITL